MKIKSLVSHPPAANSERALAHFAAKFQFETDCADVHTAIEAGNLDFVLIDVRHPDLYASGHLPEAINIPHALIDEATLEVFPPETLFVVYCSGPHCNGSSRGALRLARLGRPVKEMIGGLAGWRREGFELVPGASPREAAS